MKRMAVCREGAMKDYFVYKRIVAFLLVVACFTIIIPC